jgi:ABC-type dipeptide/oligopeptide/nickel transport system permease subunit
MKRRKPSGADDFGLDCLSSLAQASRLELLSAVFITAKVGLAIKYSATRGTGLIDPSARWRGRENLR